MSLPAEPDYAVVLPFVAPGVTAPSGTPGSGASEVSVWESKPSRLDLHFYEGDDVTIPLVFRDPNDPIFDMSDQSNWDWYAQIRTAHSPYARLLAEFICTAEYIPPTGEITYGQTKVTLYLPRQDNWHSGTYYWDLQSVSPLALGPPEGDTDPTPGVAHTWLWGKVEVEPHITHIPDEWPPWTVGQEVGTSVFLAIETGTGKTVGPSGQVGG